MAEYRNNNPDREGAAASSSGGGQSEREGGERERGRGGPGQRPPFQRRDNRRRVRVCQFCVDKARVINYKDPNSLRQFIADGGRMLSRRKTGTCARHQRMLSQAIKRARHLAMLPYTAEHTRLHSS